MDSIYLLPGEERCVNFRDSDGIPKVHYTYCSLHGRLFNCTCRSKDEAQRLLARHAGPLLYKLKKPPRILSQDGLGSNPR